MIGLIIKCDDCGKSITPTPRATDLSVIEGDRPIGDITTTAPFPRDWYSNGFTETCPDCWNPAIINERDRLKENIA